VGVTTTHALDRAIDELAAAVQPADVVVPVGGRTHWEVGGPPPVGTEVRAPSGIVEYDPAELTVTIGAGMAVGDLDDLLATAGQECPLDPRDPHATVGGVLAVGLSGPRRLRHGPLRNRLLEVHVVTGDGRRVKGGGRTVKNVSGYDVARLMVGSFGTLGVIAQVTLRCEPRPVQSVWLACDAPGAEVIRRAFRSSAVLVGPDSTLVLVEGYSDDVAAVSEALAATETTAPAFPEGGHRGRVSVAPTAIDDLVRALRGLDVRWLAEAGIGTVHVATDRADALRDARHAATDAGGWMLREAGAPGLDGFGVPLPNVAIMRRIKAALDPGGSCNPGRLPLELDVDTESPVDGEGGVRVGGRSP
jgi:glycolate oxidase FAD binding subunit